jgi:4-amino-4-deoxy-L-arabinose transferase-like glycosyltransferase
MPSAFNRWPILALLLLSAVAFVRLLAIPPFEDEGSQLRWIARILEAGEWLAPLEDGKPLEAWPMVPLVWMGLPALIVARALHVIAGAISAALTYALARHLAPRTPALLAGALLALCPFEVYLQRFALSDSLLCAANLWVLLSALNYVEQPGWRPAAALAGGLVLGALAKLPVGFVLAVAMPLALLLMPRTQRARLLRPRAAVGLLAAHAPAALLGLGVIVTALVRTRHGLSPGFGLHDFAGVGEGAYRDIGASMGLQRPSLLPELAAQLSWPVVLVGSLGVIAGVLLADWRTRWLVAVAAVPLIAIGAWASFWYGRYLLFALPPLIIAAVNGWRMLSIRQIGGRSAAARRAVQLAVLALSALCFALMGRQSAHIVLDPPAARWSALDRFQYFEGWGSGYGFPEAAHFILANPGAPRTIFALDGHSAYQLISYLPRAWSGRVRPIYYGPDGHALRSAQARLDNLLEAAPAWIVIAEPLLGRYVDTSFGNADPLTFRLVAAFDKPGGRVRLAIYEVQRRAEE